MKWIIKWIEIIKSKLNTLTSPVQEKLVLPEYLTQSIILDEFQLPGTFRFSVKLIGILFCIFLMWSTVTDIKEVATSTGQIIPSGYVQAVQHLEGGIVKEILVQEGEIVEQGQTLIKLDETNARADLGQLLARQNSLQVRTERLRAFINETSSGQIDQRLIAVEEQKVLDSMRQARESGRNVLKDQLSQKQKELEAMSSTRETLEKNLVLMEQEYQMRHESAVKGVGSKLLSITTERELNQMKGQLAETVNKEKAAQDAVQEIINRLASFDADLIQENMTTLNQAEADIAELNESIEKYSNTLNRATITAPIRGIIKGLTINTIGTIIEPGKVILEVVPVNHELLAEALVSPNDIGHIQVGQDAQVKISAYEFSRYGIVSGKLKYISASTFQSQDGNSFYKAHIQLNTNYVGQDASKNLILPGMIVQADIVTGEKTVLQYLLKPIHVAATSAFHER